MKPFKSTIVETDDSTGITISMDNARTLCTDLLKAAGLSQHRAEVTADSLLLAEKAGKTTHGLVTLPYYLRALESGGLNPTAALSCILDRGAYLLFDANNGVGRCLLREVVDVVVERAKSQTGVCCAHVRNIGHIGVLGEYCERAVRRDCVSLLFAGTINEADSALVAPPGTSARLIGSNPIACGIPSAYGAPFIFDAATAETSFFAVKQASDSDRSLPGFPLVNNVGEPSSDPADFFNGGALAPMAGVKGFGMGLMCGLLAGLVEDGLSLDSMGGVAFIALDLEVLGGGEEAKLRVAKVLQKMTSVTQNSADVRYPGQKRHECLQRASKDCKISFELRKTLCNFAFRLGVSSDCLVSTRGDVCAV